MEALGHQILLDMYECDSAILDNVRVVHDVLEAAVKECGATKVGEIIHKFHPQGVTVHICIAESHFDIHTWPESGRATADIFTCGSHLHPECAMEVIMAGLGCKKYHFAEYSRGGARGPQLLKRKSDKVEY